MLAYFGQIELKNLEIRQYSCGFFVQFAAKSDGAILALDLISVSLENKAPLALFIDEGAQNFCYITSFYDAAYIVTHKAGKKDAELKTINGLDQMDITAMLLRDIEANFEDWVRFYAFEDTEKDFARRRVMLRKLLGDAKAALRPEAKRYDKPYCE